MLIAPTERHPITSLGPTSSIPEQYGVDILFPIKSNWVGVQRKEINDLVASVYDGRLARELVMMKRCSLAVLIVEGTPQWTMDGQLMSRGQNGRTQNQGPLWTKNQHRGLLFSIASQGIQVYGTESVSDTVQMCRQLQEWLGKEKHSMLQGRPGPETVWGTPNNRDFQRHLIMGLPGIGAELADRILDTLGMPFGLRVGVKELMTVPGVGKKKAEQMLGCFNG